MKTIRSTHNIGTSLAFQALDAANDGITIVDATDENMPLIYINRKFEEMTGYSVHEVMGRNCRFLQADAKQPQECLAIRTAIANQQPCRVNLLNYRKDGTTFWNELSLAPIFDANNKLTHYVGVQKDITKQIKYRKHLEDLAKADTVTD